MYHVQCLGLSLHQTTLLQDSGPQITCRARRLSLCLGVRQQCLQLMEILCNPLILRFCPRPLALGLKFSSVQQALNLQA